MPKKDKKKNRPVFSLSFLCLFSVWWLPAGRGRETGRQRRRVSPKDPRIGAVPPTSPSARRRALLFAVPVSFAAIRGSSFCSCFYLVAQPFPSPRWRPIGCLRRTAHAAQPADTLFSRIPTKKGVGLGACLRGQFFSLDQMPALVFFQVQQSICCDSSQRRQRPNCPPAKHRRTNTNKKKDTR